MSTLNFGLTGFLLSSQTALERQDLKVFCLTFAQTVGTTKWERYGFHTDRALFNEDELDMRPPYQYPVVCRRSGKRLVLLASNHRVMDHLLVKAAQVPPHVRIRKIAIAIDGLVKHIAVNPDRYSLSFIHARLSASAAAVRSVSFYGDDVTQSRLYVDNREHLNCFGCGLRHEVHGYEAVRLGSDGAVSCASSAQNRLRQVEAALTFVSSHGFFMEPNQ